MRFFTFFFAADISRIFPACRFILIVPHLVSLTEFWDYSVSSPTLKMLFLRSPPPVIHHNLSDPDDPPPSLVGKLYVYYLLIIMNFSF